MQFQSFTKIFHVTFSPLFLGDGPPREPFFVYAPPNSTNPPPHRDSASLSCLSVREANYKRPILTGGRRVGSLVSYSEDIHNDIRRNQWIFVGVKFHISLSS